MEKIAAPDNMTLQLRQPRPSRGVGIPQRIAGKGSV